MPKRRSRTERVRDPVQVYLGQEDVGLLNRLAEESGLSKAEILRRGVRSYARELSSTASPMSGFLAAVTGLSWTGPAEVDHDAVLADEHRGIQRRK
jgi:hypothetical protein